MFRLSLFVALLLLAHPLFAGEPDDLENLIYSGMYTNTGSSKLFNYLDVSSGDIDVYFLSDLKTKQEGGGVTTGVVQLFNPKYHDQKVIAVIVNLTNYDTATHEWRAENVGMDVYTFYKENKKSKETCNGSFAITLIHQNNTWSPREQTVKVSFRSLGDNHCNYDFVAQGTYYDEKYKILAYCGFVSAVILIQIGSAYKLMRQITSNQVNADKLSLLTVCIITIQDFYLTMMHMYFLMTENQYYEYFILPIFLLVLLAVIFDMKILFVVWRTKYIQDINNGQLRRKITIFYIQFYLGMFGYLILMYFFTYDIWPLYLQAFLFLPQIVHNVRKGNNPQFYSAYVLGLLGMRLVLPLYYRGCPDNIYIIQPDTAFCIVWSSLFAIQIATLFIQKQCGPRFFIPKKFIPGHYQYKHKLEILPGTEPPECNICIQSITASQNEDISINNSMSSSLIRSKVTVTVMKTPCNHVFHPECLRHWMDVKLECPSCRERLPPIT